MERTSNAKPKPRQVNGVFHKYSTTMVVLLLLLARRSSANNRKKRTKKWCWVNPLFGGLVGCVVVGGGSFLVRNDKEEEEYAWGESEGL